VFSAPTFLEAGVKRTCAYGVRG